MTRIKVKSRKLLAFLALAGLLSGCVLKPYWWNQNPAGPALVRPGLKVLPQAYLKENFIPHVDPKPFGSYLALQLKYEAFENLRLQLEKALGFNLKNRGEAHITVITPVEYDQTLKGRLSILEINQIALNQQMQKADFQLKCVGKGELKAGDRELKTFYVVVQSEDLRMLRLKVEQAFISKGGSPSEFKALNFYPHVTLGFTDRDLHYEDGIIKDDRSCAYDLQMQEPNEVSHAN